MPGKLHYLATEYIMVYPLVSFVIFCYQQEAYIAAAVEGALQQDYPNLEILISDDCSPDRTFEIVQELVSKYKGPHQVRVNRNATNLGLGTHINYVLSQLNGDFICWNAGDDIPLFSKVSKLVAPMIEDEQVMGVDSGVHEIDLKGRVIGSRSKPPFDYEHTSLKQIIQQGLSVRSQSHAFRRKVYDHFGDFEPFITNEGRPLAFREKLLGKIIFIDEPQTLYRIGSGISTYSGEDINKLTVSEPLKILGWQLTSMLQIQMDLEKAAGFLDGKSEASIRIVLEEEIKRAGLRKEIIEQPWNFRGLLRSLTSVSMVKRGTIDFIKRNFPQAVLYIFYKINRY